MRRLKIAIAKKAFKKRTVAVLSSMFYMPLSCFNEKELKTIKEFYTIKVIDPYANQSIEEGFRNAGWRGETNRLTYNVVAETVVESFDLSKPEFIGLPRDHAKTESSVVIDRTTKGPIMTNWPKKDTIKARDTQQQEFMEELANVCRGEGPKDIVANANTGSGKTVADLWLTLQLRLPTLVIVPTNRLKDQWIGSVEQKRGMRYFFGEEWCSKYVGTVQQDVCDYRGKLIVVGMSPSLASRDYGKDFYRHFGKITYDEVHKAATPVISEILKKFPSKIRIGYTATNRTDALKKITDWHLGKPKVVSTQKVMSAKVYIYNYRQKEPMFAYNEFAIISNLAKLQLRNELIRDLIINRGINRGRQILVLSDRVEQLQWLQRVLPGYVKVGLYVGEYYIGEKRRNNNTGKYVKVKRKTTKEALEYMEKNSQVILATYGMMELGVDIPRLDMGIEATPRGNVTQAIGRILRECPDKSQPEWYSINDHILDRNTGQTHSKLSSMAFSRVHSFNKQGCQVKVVN